MLNVPPDAHRVVDALGLTPLADEGGLWAQSYLDDRCSAIYFLLRPDDFSAMHRVGGVELWHFYAGAPVSMLLLEPSATRDTASVAEPVLGVDVAAGQRPMVAVSAGVWMGAETTGDWSLVGTTMAPPFDADTFELANADELREHYPSAASRISRLVRP